MRNLFVPLALLCLALGCRTLDPAGPYKGDKVLFESHRAYLDAYDLMETYVKWEFDNRDALRSRPEIRRSANVIRRNAQQWLATAGNLIDAYSTNPNDDNRSAMVKAIDTLRAAMAEAARYMSEQKQKGAIK